MSIVRTNGNAQPQRPLHQIALLGSYFPRQCGIATFTADLAHALSDSDSHLTIDTIAVSDRAGYAYPPRVSYEIAERDRASYRSAADYINRFGYDLLSVQHEYGIYGGQAGDYLMSLVREVKMPIVTTLHTVLRDPTPSQKAVLDELLQLSERVVVMSKKAIGYLQEVHNLSPEKVDLIPHGIPSIPESVGRGFRAKLGIDGPMILTFGLLSPDKGIQYAIEAIPEIVRHYPGATYFVVGATHPNIRANSGEAYRESLVRLASDLGVSANVRFIDRYVEKEELVEYLAATDVYITPYLNPKQITSGTLAYAIGAGKAVISTPYAYAEDLLADGRGMLVDFRSAKAISDAVLEIEHNPETREEMVRKAGELGRQMLWPAIGASYLETFTRAKRDSATRLRVLVQNSVLTGKLDGDLPELRLDHLLDLSDDTGIIQHATFTVPNRSEGYCVDDNARALLLTVLMEGQRALSTDLSRLQSRYLSFILDAYNHANGRFRNFMSYNRTWLEEAGSEDSHGRSLWSLGATVRLCRDVSRRDLAKYLFELAMPAVVETTSLRTWAYSILAASEFLDAYPLDVTVREFMQTMANRLWEQYGHHHSEEWPWFEQHLTYGNARLAQSLMLAGHKLDHPKMLRAGLVSLEWLMKIQSGPDGVFAPIGSNGFYHKNEVRSYFDQQPIEASGAVSACLSAHRLTGRSHWVIEAKRAFRWFLGENMLGAMVYDRSTSGCYDGMHADRVNRNQGAESTLSFLCALAEMRVASAPKVSAVIGKYDLK